MSGVPSLAALDYKCHAYDREWTFHQLPKDNISIPREHLPDPEADAIPGGVKQESLAELERRWLDLGIDRIRLTHSTVERHHSQ